MRKTRTIAISAATLLVIVLSGAVLSPQPAEAEGQCLPGQILDLRDWKLTLPIKKAKEIEPPDLNEYENKYFTDEPANSDEPPCTSVAFRTPVGGATTSGSDYPRTELREMKKKGQKLASWSSTSGTHEMSWRVAVDTAPEAKPQLVVGQVHDSDDDVVQILYDGNQDAITYRWMGETAGVLVSDYELGTYVDLRIVVTNGTLNIHADGELKAARSRSTSGLYFKAGNYTQSNPARGGDPDLVTQVRISELTVSHGG